jgi:hypothetical protein
MARPRSRNLIPRRDLEADLHRRLAEAHLTAAAACGDMWTLQTVIAKMDFDAELRRMYEEDTRRATDLLGRALDNIRVNSAKLEELLTMGVEPDFTGRATPAEVLSFLRKPVPTLSDSPAEN